MAISPSSSRAHGIPVGTLGAVLGLGVRFSTDWENGGEYECLALHRAFLYILSQGSLQRSGALTFHRNPLLKIFQNFEAFLRLSSATQLFIPKCRYWVAFSFLKSHTLRAGSAGRSWLCLYKEGIPPNFSLLLFFFFSISLSHVIMNSKLLKSRIPIAHLKVDTVVPAAACHQSSVNALTSLFSATAISTPIVNQAAAVMSTSTRPRLTTPVNRAKTTPVLPKHTQQKSLAANLAAPISAAVTARIQKRHQLTVAKLTAAKRPQQPVKATRPAKAPVTAIATSPRSLPVGVPTPLAIPSPPIPVGRSASPASTRKYVLVVVTMKSKTNLNTTVQTGHISDIVDISVDSFTRPSRIPHPPRHPSTTTSHRIRTLINPKKLRQVYLRLRRVSYRGSSPFCACNDDGELFVPSMQCPIRHGHDPSCQRGDDPTEWATTTAEDFVVPARCSHNKKVHWGHEPAKVIGTFDKWIMEAYGPTVDPRDRPPSPPPSPQPPPPHTPRPGGG